MAAAKDTKVGRARTVNTNYVTWRDTERRWKERAKDVTENTAANKKTSTRTVLIVYVCLRYLATFLKFEKKVNTITLHKYGKYSIIAKYRLEDA